MNYLFVVAHPDDEVLGAGAFIVQLTEEGHNVDVVVLTFQHKDRNKGDFDVMLKQMKESHEVLGIRKSHIGFFPNAKLHTSPQSEVVSFIEKCISESKPDYIYTHHYADVNIDHQACSITTQVAARYTQRQLFDDSNDFKIKGLFYMEIQSSTDWFSNKALSNFRPDTFVEINTESLNKKLIALNCYDDVVRPLPHPRANASVMALATIRGTQSGFIHAEAFETAFRFEEMTWRKNHGKKNRSR